MTNESPPEQPTRRRRLWPWVVDAILLCLLAVAGSLLWPVYKVNELVRFAQAHPGGLHVYHQHPRWMERFIAEETFVPGYDHFEVFSVVDLPISDDRFRTLCRNSKLTSLRLDVSNCSVESLAELKHTNLLNLQLVHLHRCWQEEFPLDWIDKARNGCHVSLEGLTVTPDEWSTLLNSRVGSLGISETMTTVTVSDDLECSLSLSWKDLTQKEAEAILQIPDLKRLTLSFSSATPEFWQTLSRHPDLRSLKIRSGTKTARQMISATELDQIAKIPSLSEITITDDFNKLERDDETCERFVEMRPDVSLTIYTGGGEPPHPHPARIWPTTRNKHRWRVTPSPIIARSV